MLDLIDDGVVVNDAHANHATNATHNSIYLIVEPVDMRMGIDGLSSCIQTRLGSTPCAGGIYVFSNARCTRLKLLLWDGTGVWLAQRRLHSGRFTWCEGESSAAEITTKIPAAQHNINRLAWQGLIKGIDWPRMIAQARDHKHWRVG